MRDELEVLTEWIDLNHDLRNVNYLLKNRPDDGKLLKMKAELEEQLREVEREKKELKVVGDGR